MISSLIWRHGGVRLVHADALMIALQPLGGVRGAAVEALSAAAAFHGLNLPSGRPGQHTPVGQLANGWRTNA